MDKTETKCLVSTPAEAHLLICSGTLSTNLGTLLLVPVTVIEYDPGVECGPAVTAKIAPTPPALMLVGVMPAETPCGTLLMLRLTFPVNPFTAVVLIVVLPVGRLDLLTIMLEGFALNVKDPPGVTVTLTEVERTTLPPVPETVNAYVPAGTPAAVTVIADDPLPLIVVGLKLTLKPAVLLALSVTVPVKPPTAPMLTVEPALPDCETEKEDGDADIEKSGGVAGVVTATSAELGPSPDTLEADTT